jgi:alkylated DNA repair dioxygenase AlkB
MNECPPNDPHRCALYAYTEEGDYMGWHYDTSYYKDRRWTVLVGFKDESSSRLLCLLHTRNPDRDVVKLELQIKPGTLVIFNGDKVYHAVSPLKEGESRYIVSMQYVTNGEMNPFMRFISNMKDAVAYFGLRGVFGKGKVR